MRPIAGQAGRYGMRSAALKAHQFRLAYRGVSYRLGARKSLIGLWAALMANGFSWSVIVYTPTALAKPCREHYDRTCAKLH